MEVAVRSYLAAGTALVGATAIALAPVEVAPPDIQVKNDRTIVAVDDVDLTAFNAFNPAAWVTAAALVLNGYELAGNAMTGAATNAIQVIGDAYQNASIVGLNNFNYAWQAVAEGFLGAFGAIVLPSMPPPPGEEQMAGAMLASSVGPTTQSMLTPLVLASQFFNPIGWVGAGASILNGFQLASNAMTGAATNAIQVIGDAYQNASIIGLNNTNFAWQAIAEGFLGGFASLVLPPVITPPGEPEEEMVAATLAATTGVGAQSLLAPLALGMQFFNPVSWVGAGASILNGFQLASNAMTGAATTAIQVIGDAYQNASIIGLNNANYAWQAIAEGFLGGFASLVLPPVITPPDTGEGEAMLASANAFGAGAQSLLAPLALGMQFFNPIGWVGAGASILNGFQLASNAMTGAATNAIQVIGDAYQNAGIIGLNNANYAWQAIAQGFLGAFASLVLPPVVTPPEEPEPEVAALNDAPTNTVLSSSEATIVDVSVVETGDADEVTAGGDSLAGAVTETVKSTKDSLDIAEESSAPQASTATAAAPDASATTETQVEATELESVSVEPEAPSVDRQSLRVDRQAERQAQRAERQAQRVERQTQRTERQTSRVKASVAGSASSDSDSSSGTSAGSSSSSGGSSSDSGGGDSDE